MGGKRRILAAAAVGIALACAGIYTYVSDPEKDPGSAQKTVQIGIAVYNEKDAYISHVCTYLDEEIHEYEAAHPNVKIRREITDAGGSQQEQNSQIERVGEGDAIIAISFPRYSKKAVKALQYASDKGAATVAVTDSPLSPLAQYAAHLLLARSDMVSFVDSLVGPLSVLNALIVSVAIRKKDEVADTLRQIESIWDEYGVYEKVDEKST